LILYKCMTSERVTDTPPALRVILERRSIKTGFRDIEIDPAVIDSIIECGLSAPSSKNAQPWRMHVVTNKLTLHGIAEHIDSVAEQEKREFRPVDPSSGNRRSYVSTVSESAQVLREVPLGIFIENQGKFSNGRQSVSASPDSVRVGALIGVGLEYIGLGASIENMWLAAQAHDISGVFMGDVLIAEDTIKSQLGMVGDLVGVLALGYSDREPGPKVVENNVVRHI